MASAKPAKKTGVPGVKVLITAASLAATLGGWALISQQETKATPPPAPAQTAATSTTIKLAPLPTLVPVMKPAAPRAANSQPRAANAAPSVAPANEIVLRDVSAADLPSRSAPAPAANTGSSR